MELDLDSPRAAAQNTATPVILLDTNALIWLDQGHRRARPLQRRADLALSPASLLELQFLAESGRIQLGGSGMSPLVEDERWILDEPPAAAWFLRAADLGWTRDPFDRLIVAHARLRGWRLATADERLLKELHPDERMVL